MTATGQGTIMDNDDPPPGTATTTQQPQPTPTATPTPEPQTLAALPNPVLGQEVNVQQVSGTVLINVKGQGFVPLSESAPDPRRHRCLTRPRARSGCSRPATAAARASRPTSRADLFQVLQARTAKGGLTDLVLKGSSFKNCKPVRRGKKGKRVKRRKRGRRASISASRTIRRLSGSGRGRFRTRGRHSSATVRGTKWDTIDRCDGTLTKVKRGTVAVRDFRLKKNVIVRAGKSYLARAAR